jgi:hypothetical protein
MLDQRRSGDTLVVRKLDRLSGSLKDLLTIPERVSAAGAKCNSLAESIDTSGPAGRMLMQMLGAFAEFEREMIRERIAPVCMKHARKVASPGESRKSPQSKRKRLSKPCHSGARRPLKLPDCSKFTAQPSRASSLRRSSESEPPLGQNPTMAPEPNDRNGRMAAVRSSFRRRSARAKRSFPPSGRAERFRREPRSLRVEGEVARHPR